MRFFFGISDSEKDTIKYVVQLSSTDCPSSSTDYIQLYSGIIAE